MSFDYSRLRRADQIIGGGAIALFIILFFFKWYGGSVSSPIGGINLGSSLNGWHSFTDRRWIWLLTILVALGAVALVASQRALSSPVGPGAIVAALGALSVILILYRIVHHPSASSNFGGVHASYGIKIGIWLGLIAAAAITYGGYLAMQAEGTSLEDVGKQAGAAFSGLTSPASDSPSEPTGGGRTAGGSTGSAGGSPGAPAGGSAGAPATGSVPSTPMPPAPSPTPPPQTPPSPTPAPQPPSPEPPTPAPSPGPPIPPPAVPPGESPPPAPSI